MDGVFRGVDKAGGPFLIRPYRVEDRPGLSAMFDDFEPKRAAQGLPPADERARERWLDLVLDQGIHLIVEVDGVLRGHGMIIPFGEHRGELANFLHQSARDRGIGTALNRELLRRSADRGIRRVWLSVEPSNRAAVRSYEKVGFRRVPVTSWSPELEMEAEVGRSAG